jgi:RNA polymerase sigma factor (sigma-70 family)
MSTNAPGKQRHRPYVVAMVLGTALSAFGAERALAAPEAGASLRAINDLGRYCTTCWRNARLPVDSWGDCTQEVFTRLLERVPTSRWPQALSADGEEHREFLRAIDTVKKRTQRARRFSPAVDGAADPRDRHERRLAEDREAVRHAAGEVLSPRQQRILQMSMEGWSVQDVARELAIPAERVSDEKYKAVRKLRACLGIEG